MGFELLVRQNKQFKDVRLVSGKLQSAFLTFYRQKQQSGLAEKISGRLLDDEIVSCSPNARAKRMFAFCIQHYTGDTVYDDDNYCETDLSPSRCKFMLYTSVC